MTAALLSFLVGLIVGLVIGAMGEGWPLYVAGLAAAVWCGWWAYACERHPGRWWGEP